MYLNTTANCIKFGNTPCLTLNPIILDHVGNFDNKVAAWRHDSNTSITEIVFINKDLPIEAGWVKRSIYKYNKKSYCLPLPRELESTILLKTKVTFAYKDGRYLVAPIGSEEQPSLLAKNKGIIEKTACKLIAYGSQLVISTKTNPELLDFFTGESIVWMYNTKDGVLTLCAANEIPPNLDLTHYVIKFRRALEYYGYSVIPIPYKFINEFQFKKGEVLIASADFRTDFIYISRD